MHYPARKSDIMLFCIMINFCSKNTLSWWIKYHGIPLC